MKKHLYFNYYYIIIGVFAIYSSSLNFEKRTALQDDSFKSLQVELASNIIKVKGSKNPIDYKFWIKDNKALFIIKDGSIPINKRKKIEALKKGTFVTLKVKNTTYDNNSSKNQRITVYGVYLNNNALLSINDTKEGRNKYLKRVNILLIFAGIMFFINGLIIIDKKINFAISIIFIATLITMKILEIGIY